MFRAILIPKDLYFSSGSGEICDFCDRIIDKITVYPSSDKYLLCIASEENIPPSIREQLKPIVIDSALDTGVHTFQHYYYRITDITNPGINRQLMAMRSKLAYVVSENLAPDRFYFQLETPVNDTSTRRQYVYKLYYDEIPCYALANDTLISDFYTAVQQQLGPLIASTYGLDVMGLPRWYVKEMFRDIIELGEFRMQDKILLVGPNTQELYLFYQQETNITEDVLSDLIIEIRGRISAAIHLRLFPRNTPLLLRKSRQLKQLPSGQWTFNYCLPPHVSIFSTTLQQCFTLNGLNELFWFLTWLMLCPTYPFIEPELKICVEPNTVRVCHATVYLPDYLRVKSASRVHPENREDEVSVIYPDRLSTEILNQQLQGKTYIRFYDHANNERAIILHPEIQMPRIERTFPPDYTLDRRIEYDVDPEAV